MNQNQDDHELRLLIDQRTREWNRKFQAMQAEIQRKNELIHAQRNRVDMQTYIQRRLSEERDEIAPELIDFIQGDSVEQVEASISTAKAKTASILDGIREATSEYVPSATAQPEIPSQPQEQPQPQPQGQQLTPEQRSAMTPFTVEQLAAVEPGSEAHLAMRRQYGLDKAGRGRGIFG